MRKSVGTDQSHAIIQALANNVDWDALDGELLQKKVILNQKEAGRLFTLFLLNGCESLKEPPRVININRDEPFDPVMFFNADWNNQSGEVIFIDYTPSEHETGKGWRVKSENEMALALNEIDLNEILLESTLSKNEHGTTIKERILRLKNAGQTLLDAAVFKSFIDNQGLIPASFKRKINHEPIRIFFDGSIFENEAGDEHVLYLLYVENKVHWHYAWTGSTCNQSDYSAVLNNGGKVIVDGPRVISIDRSIPFDPKTFIGKGWSIVEQDERSVALTEIDLTSVVFDSTLIKGEKRIKGEDRLNRLKETKNRIRLDAGIFKTLWENQILIPEKWKEKTNGNTTYIFFEGTVLRSPDARRSALYLYVEDGEWRCSYYWLDDDRNANNPSAVL